MLPGERIKFLDELQAIGRVLLHDLRLAHFVKTLDGYFGIFGAVFDQSDHPILLQRLSHCLEHVFGMREFMIDVDHQDQVESICRQPRVVKRTEDRDHVFHTLFFRPFTQINQHLRLDIDTVNNAFFTGQLGHS